MLLGNIKLKSIEGLISRNLIDSYISHDKSVSLNNVTREYDNMILICLLSNVILLF